MSDPSDPPPAASHVDVQYTSSDLFALNRAVWRRWLRLLLWLFAVLAAMQVIFPMLGGESFSAAIDTLDSVPLIAAPLMLFLIVSISPLLTMRTRKKNGWDIPLHFTFTDDRIVIDHAQGKTELIWRSIKRIDAGNRRVLLFTSPACAYIFPRRIFATEEAFSDFSRDLERRWRIAKVE